jgi:hypothetical protein
MIRSREESLAVRTFQEIAEQASMEPYLRARMPHHVLNYAYEGKPIPDDLLPGRFLEDMKKRLSPEEVESLKLLTPDLIQDRVRSWQ